MEDPCGVCYGWEVDGLSRFLPTSLHQQLRWHKA